MRARFFFRQIKNDGIVLSNDSDATPAIHHQRSIVLPVAVDA